MYLSTTVLACSAILAYLRTTPKPCTWWIICSNFATLIGKHMGQKTGEVNAMITMTAREFNQDTARAKRLALNNPVLITDRGKPSHVLLDVTEYESILAQLRQSSNITLADALAMPDDEYIEFEPVRLQVKFKVPDLED